MEGCQIIDGLQSLPVSLVSQTSRGEMLYLAMGGLQGTDLSAVTHAGEGFLVSQLS